MQIQLRPVLSVEQFEQAIESARLSESDQELIEYIRYTGVFSQPSIIRDLRIQSKPPVLSILCEICRKIGEQVPEHFKAIRLWSQSISEHDVHWDGDLICSTAFSIDGERLTPEYEGTTPQDYPGNNDQYSIAGYHYDRRTL